MLIIHQLVFQDVTSYLIHTDISEYSHVFYEFCVSCLESKIESV